VDYDIYKTFEDLFLTVEQRDNMMLKGFQSEKLSKMGTRKRRASPLKTS